MEKIYEVLGKAMVGIVLVIAVLGFSALITGLPIKWLWNALISSDVTMALFGVAKLTFWRAFGLSILCGLLFKTASVNKKD